jgi:hypothetical protein
MNEDLYVDTLYQNNIYNVLVSYSSTDSYTLMHLDVTGIDFSSVTFTRY